MFNRFKTEARKYSRKVHLLFCISLIRLFLKVMSLYGFITYKKAVAGGVL